jgi:hypothetical protein
MAVEIERQNIDKLFATLKEYVSLNDFRNLNSELAEGCKLFINITFLNSTGDLRIEVPSVPGRILPE